MHIKMHMQLHMKTDSLESAHVQGTVGPALLCGADTPGLWMAFRRIFVLIVHNTRCESLVSKQKSLEHHNHTELMVEHRVLHHSRMEAERALLTRREMRKVDKLLGRFTSI